MSIRRLSLSDFRNHAEARLDPAHPFILLTGENGAGKTNILEAVSLLAPGRGLRGAPLREVARQDGPGGFGIAAEIDAGVSLGTGATAKAPDRRQVRVNGAAAPATALAEWLSILWLTPAMDRLFMEAPSGRRRFLDRLTLALHPGHAINAARYEGAMRQRNSLLAEEKPGDPAWLDALEEQMATHAAAIDEAREDTVARLNAALADNQGGPFGRPLLNLAGWTGREGPLRAALATGRRRDAAAGRTLSGPHRSDLAAVHAGNGQAAALCSTGEQKALLLSIILSHAMLVADRVGRPPILLLDEVAAHLDPRRRDALFQLLRDTGAQIWMTGTEGGLFDGIGAATRLHVHEGKVREDS